MRVSRPAIRWEKAVVRVVIKWLILIVAALLLSACASMSMKTVKGPVVKAAFAYTFDSNQLCHNYRGLMVFDNFQKTYELPRNFEEEFKSRVLSVFSRRGVEVEVISIDTVSAPGKRLLIDSSWDNTAKVNPEYLPRFRQIMSKKDVDTVFVSEPWPKPKSRDSCLSVIDYSPVSESGFSSGSQLLRVFTADGDRVGELYTYVRKKNIPPPQDPTVLTEDFLNLVIDQVLQRLESELDAYLVSRNGSGSENQADKR